MLASAEPIRRAMQPAISPDGKVVVFSWQGDLWRVPSSGGHAERLTVHPATDTRPRWFGDGSRIAFASARYGSNDVFTMKPDGSDIHRVTFDSASEIPTCVSSDGRAIYGYTNAFGRQDLFKVDASGGDLIRLTDHPFEYEYLPQLSLDGKKVYYNRGSYGSSSWLKAGMTSSALPDVWVADNTVPLSNHRRVTNNEKIDLQPTPAQDGYLYLISNANGMPNVWRMKPDGSSPKQLTFHTAGTARNLSVSADGKRVVYEQDSDLYVLSTDTGATRKLEIDVPDDARTNPVVDLTATSGVQGFAVAPDGKRAVIQLRGDLFLIPEKGGTTRRLTTNPAWDMQAVWLDAKTILYVASGHGQRKLRSISIDGQSKDFVTDPSDVTHPAVAPDGKSVAFHRGESEICVVPTAGGVPKTILKGNFYDAVDGAPMFSWSPDSKWIVAEVVDGRRIDVVTAPVDGGKAVTVAKLVYRSNRGIASTPRFLPNGKSIYFTSPEYDDQDLFVVDLIPTELTFSEDDLDKLDEPKKEEPKAEAVTVYEPGIEYRLRRLTTNGASGPFASPDSKTIYFNQRTQGAPSQLVSVPVAGGTVAPVQAVSGGAEGMEASKDGKKLYFISRGGLFGYTLGTPTASAIPFNAQWTVDLKEEQEALFRDITWAMERLYYNPKLNNKDWPSIKARYERTVPYVYDRGDFYALMEEMMEELESSHLGSNPPNETVPGVGSDATGYLGIEFDPKALDAKGAYVVEKVVPQSPASDPQSQVLVGDRLVSVDGNEVGKAAPFATLLNRKAGKKVLLVVERGGVLKTVAIKPLAPSGKSSLEYEAWVAQERALTDRYSGGTFGYVHIRGMDRPSLERFVREIHTQAEGKRGLLIDCRYNGGGSTAVDVLNILVRQPWLLRTTRGDYGARLSENIWRSDALEMPSALLVNTYSYSNAEIIAEGFRRLKRGPIVGERTPGYVIGTGGYALWDGGSIRMPSIGAYSVEGENLENNGRRPDIDVPFDPNVWSVGDDAQLKKAVEALRR